MDTVIAIIAVIVAFSTLGGIIYAMWRFIPAGKRGWSIAAFIVFLLGCRSDSAHTLTDAFLNGICAVLVVSMLVWASITVGAGIWRIKTKIGLGLFILLCILVPPIGLGALIYWLFTGAVADGVERGIRNSKDD